MQSVVLQVRVPVYSIVFTRVLKGKRYDDRAITVLYTWYGPDNKKRPHRAKAKPYCDNNPHYSCDLIPFS